MNEKDTCDKELLELAAKAAGMRLNHAGQPTTGNYYDSADFIWNPLTDDGDALRLMVELGMDILFQGYKQFIVVVTNCATTEEPYSFDMKTSTRRAIVRAAAEIGRDMK